MREVDFGGCRCRAMALTGDAAATDPACELSPMHALLGEIAARDSTSDLNDYAYRGRPFRDRREAER
jgi:pyrroloquinoline quinone biosynthesis protein E